MISVIECAKRDACKTAVNDWLRDGQKVGIGSGTTVEYAVEAIAAKVNQENWRIQCVPTSFQAKGLIARNNLETISLDIAPELDVAFDGADEVCEDLSLIKGGGGCLLQEKIVASCATDFIVLVDERKCSKGFGLQWTKGLPIEVVPMAYKPIQLQIERLFGGKAILRQAVAKMGPVVTDNGNFLLDWKFDPSMERCWFDVESKLAKIPGIVETGLFLGITRRVYIGNLDGSVKYWDAQRL